MRLPNADQAPPPRAQKAHDPVSSAFILTVQHLIERCLTFYLDQDECVRALSRHAGIDPIITATVWKELEKANKDFFEEYGSKRRSRRSQMSCRRVLRDTTNRMPNLVRGGVHEDDDDDECESTCCNSPRLGESQENPRR